MEKEVTKESKYRHTWGDVYGRRWILEDLTDRHLVNIIHHIKRTGSYPRSILHDMISEAESRGLSDTLLDYAQIPHKNPDTGRWAHMVYREGESPKIEELSKKEVKE